MSDEKWFETLSGQEINGSFVLEQFLGSGNIGYVYRAREKKPPNRTVALKVVPGNPKQGWDTELSKVSLLAGIRGVVPYYNSGTDIIKSSDRSELVHYTVWHYIDPGRNLGSYLEEEEFIPATLLTAVAETVLRVLHACSCRNVRRHGDLHVGNILIGGPDLADLDDENRPRTQIWVSDFGRGATWRSEIRDDYAGLAAIIQAILERVDWETANASDRKVIRGMSEVCTKVLLEKQESERTEPLDLLAAISRIKKRSRIVSFEHQQTTRGQPVPGLGKNQGLLKVGEYQISEMLGENWHLWRELFVPNLPVRSRILEPDITTVLTGPRGCGKTMLFRRLSERLRVECGDLDQDPQGSSFVGFYVNANDIADAFSTFPDEPDPELSSKLICYANLCFLADFLSVLSSREAKFDEQPSGELLDAVSNWFGRDREGAGRLVGESRLEIYRAHLEDVKWYFPTGCGKALKFESYEELGRHSWIDRFVKLARRDLDWIKGKRVFVFIDDYSTPRITGAMQRVLNRLYFYRSSEYVCKIATESATTFLAEDFSGKLLQDGDDFQLVDMGEESLFLSDEERANFLSEIFRRRLVCDSRISPALSDLASLFGATSMSKTEFARKLREQKPPLSLNEATEVDGKVTYQARGRSKKQVHYEGVDVFCNLWSGDTRTMIQIAQDLVDEATGQQGGIVEKKVPGDLQDKVFRNRGGLWLEAQTRNLPSDASRVEAEVAKIRRTDKSFSLTGGSYGGHLKAVVEAFQVAARYLLLGPTYTIVEKGREREVPRMAFRIEVVDEFRLDGLAAEVYRDLIRYGIFMRDARGKSVRGFMVPRLYLRRLLLPYCRLALSKRDNVPLTCDWLKMLLIDPDRFKDEWVEYREAVLTRHNSRQLNLNLESVSLESVDEYGVSSTDPAYDDLGSGG